MRWAIFAACLSPWIVFLEHHDGLCREHVHPQRAVADSIAIRIVGDNQLLPHDKTPGKRLNTLLRCLGYPFLRFARPQ